MIFRVHTAYSSKGARPILQAKSGKSNISKVLEHLCSMLAVAS